MSISDDDDDKKPKSRNKKVTKFKITSSDGARFIISISAAVVSTALKDIWKEKGFRARKKVISHVADHVDGVTLAMVIDYLNAHSAKSRLSKDEKRRFDGEFVSGKEFDVLAKLVMAADNLRVAGLREIVLDKMAGVIQTKSGGWTRRAFGKPDDLTAEDKEEIRQRYCFVDWNADEERERAETEAEKSNCVQEA